MLPPCRTIRNSSRLLLHLYHSRGPLDCIRRILRHLRLGRPEAETSREARATAGCGQNRSRVNAGHATTRPRAGDHHLYPPTSNECQRIRDKNITHPERPGGSPTFFSALTDTSPKSPHRDLPAPDHSQPLGVSQRGRGSSYLEYPTARPINSR